VIKWEREHHQNLEGKKLISYAEDADGTLLMSPKDIVPPAAMGEAEG